MTLCNISSLPNNPNGNILPISLIEHIKNYLEICEDSFSLTCRLWSGILPTTLNLGIWKYTCEWDGKDTFLRIFQKYREQSRLIDGLDLTNWEGLSDDNFIQLKNYNLRTLNLYKCKALTEKALTYLKTPSSLTRLDLTFTKIRDFSLAGLAKLPLKQLNICHMDDLSDDHLKTIGQLQHLTFLDMRGCEAITNKGYTFLKTLPLQVLKIGPSKHINNETIESLVHCTSLTDLTMKDCEISDLSPLSSVPLKRLDVSGCKNISSVEIMTYLNNHKIEDAYDSLVYFTRRELLDLTFFGTRRILSKLTNIITGYAISDKHFSRTDVTL